LVGVDAPEFGPGVGLNAMGLMRALPFKLGTPIMGGCCTSSSLLLTALLLLLLLFTSCINPWSMFKFLLLFALMLMQVELDSAK
jgi:hypothetical protein